jgi:hypothetical protein
VSKLAQADVPVLRSSLVRGQIRAGVRRLLYNALGRLGRVEEVVGYVVDPPDGPFADPAYAGEVDRDEYAIVRIRGKVSPRLN